jgi:hypothetical protein
MPHSNRRSGPGIPIIRCSGFSDRITPEKAEALGIEAADHVKPV